MDRQDDLMRRTSVTFQNILVFLNSLEDYERGVSVESLKPFLSTLYETCVMGCTDVRIQLPMPQGTSGYVYLMAPEGFVARSVGPNSARPVDAKPRLELSVDLSPESVNHVHSFVSMVAKAEEPRLPNTRFGRFASRLSSAGTCDPQMPSSPVSLRVNSSTAGSVHTYTRPTVIATPSSAVSSPLSNTRFRHMASPVDDSHVVPLSPENLSTLDTGDANGGLTPAASVHSAKSRAPSEAGTETGSVHTTRSSKVGFRTSSSLRGGRKGTTQTALIIDESDSE